MIDYKATLRQIRELADGALEEMNGEVTIRLSDGTAAFGQFDELKPVEIRGHHGYREPGVPAGLTTLEPIGEHTGEVHKHFHWQFGSTLFGRGLTSQQLRAHANTTSALGTHNSSMLYMSAIVDAVTGEVLVPEDVTIYYKDWGDEAPQKPSDGYRPMVRARLKTLDDGRVQFSIIFPEDGDRAIVNPELTVTYAKPKNGWKCQTSGKTGSEHFVHGGYIPAQSDEFSEYLKKVADPEAPQAGQAVDRANALPERLQAGGVKMFDSAHMWRFDNWPEVPKL